MKTVTFSCHFHSIVTIKTYFQPKFRADVCLHFSYRNSLKYNCTFILQCLWKYFAYLFWQIIKRLDKLKVCYDLEYKCFHSTNFRRNYHFICSFKYPISQFLQRIKNTLSRKGHIRQIQLIRNFLNDFSFSCLVL